MKMTVFLSVAFGTLFSAVALGQQDPSSCGTRIQDALEACNRAHSEVDNRCERGQLYGQIARDSQSFDRKLNKDDANFTQVCDSYKKFQNNQSSNLSAFENNCSAAIDNCINYCDANLIMSNMGECSGQITSEVQQITQKRNYCSTGKSNVSARVADLKKYYTNSSKNAEACGVSTAAEEKGSSGDDKSAETKSDSKGSDLFNSQNLGAMLAGAGALLGAFNSTQGLEEYPQTTMAPAQLEATSCLRPENANTCLCNMRMCTSDAANPTYQGQVLPGSGGAAMTKDEATPNLDLGSTGPEFPTVHPDQGGSASAAGAYAGGGGGGFGGGGNFTPDQPQGKGGSRLSADILAGTQRGGATGGMMGAAGVGRNNNAGGGLGALNDPDKLPGYTLSGKPDFRQFLPPGAGVSPTREVSGFAGDANRSFCPPSNGCIPPNANLFNEIGKRYQALSATLYP